jgi:hypothetical protein
MRRAPELYTGNLPAKHAIFACFKRPIGAQPPQKGAGPFEQERSADLSAASV